MKKLIAICLCLIVLCSMPFSVYASSIKPYYNNFDRVNTVFTISGSGVATVKILTPELREPQKAQKLWQKCKKRLVLFGWLLITAVGQIIPKPMTLLKVILFSYPEKDLIVHILCSRFPAAAEVMIKSLKMLKRRIVDWPSGNFSHTYVKHVL